MAFSVYITVARECVTKHTEMLEDLEKPVHLALKRATKARTCTSLNVALFEKICVIS